MERLANWVLRMVKRDPIGGVTARIIGVRDAGLEMITRVWRSAVVASALGKLGTYVILMLSLRFAGVPSDVIAAAQAFLV